MGIFNVYYSLFDIKDRIDEYIILDSNIIHLTHLLSLYTVPASVLE